MRNNITIWVFEPAKSFRHFLFPQFKILTFRDMRDNLFEPPTKKIQSHVWRRIVIQLMGTELQFKIATKNYLISALAEFERKGNPYPSATQILKKSQEDAKDAGSFRKSAPMESVENRFGALNEYDFYSRKVNIPIEDLMRTDMVIEMGDSDTENDKFRTAMLLSRLYHYKRLNETDHFNLIIMDEGRELFSHATTGFGEKELEKQYALARKMKIGFVVATQEPKSVSTTIKANVRTMIAFPLSDGKELWDASASLNLTKPQREYYQGLSAFGHGHAIVKYGGIPGPFPVQFPDVPNPQKTVTQQEIDQHNDEFLRQYKIPDPPPKPQPTPSLLPPISKNEERMLRTVYDNPMSAVTEMYKISGIEPSHCSGIKDELIDKKYLDEEKVKIKAKKRALKFVRLTPEACQKLRLKPRSESRPGIKHEIYCRLVRQKLEDQGWTCTFEGQTNNHPHKMDVLATKDGQRHDYEITIHLKNIEDNINNALGSKLADKVIIIADDKKITKCRTMTADEQKKYGDALEFQPISEFYIG